jgi:hypothetical protein
MSTSNTLSSGTPLEILALESSWDSRSRLINALCRGAVIDSGHLHEHRNYGNVHDVHH